MQIMMSIKKSWNKLSRAIPDNKMVRILIAKQLKDSAYYCTSHYYS